ncbi:tyrosinase family protein [Scytonema sp. UIC 10036]|uniref:tyrosinase family protein n=1 Tax=Scytonema sp. UIC 10036 TaxID=2304196 RepID=UPI0012DA6753|nr:tyrosinase family protein [Scytonema sp. UIC 10036]MUG91674.1 tyrosinase family protein [Scytonema sp. UIC 10036]
MKNIRKNVRDLSSTEKQNYIETVKAVKASTSRTTNRSIYDEYVLWHILATEREDPNDPRHFRNAAHAGPAFLPWHRYYLYRFERQLQKKIPGVTIPYWDWTQDADDPFNSPIWDADFMGGNGDPEDNNLVKTGPFATDRWITINLDGSPKGGIQREFGKFIKGLPTQTNVRIAIEETPYDREPWSVDSSPSHRNRLEGFLPEGGAFNPDGTLNVAPDGTFVLELHNQVHAWIGGDMSNVFISPNDPVFWLHHCNVDRLWAIWQEKNPSQGYLPTGEGPEGHNLYDLMYPWDGQTVKLKAKPADVLDSRKLGIYYA